MWPGICQLSPAGWNTIDLTAPAGTTVNDGTGDDISYTGSDTTLSANWPAFTEDVSGFHIMKLA
jgi:hypothetical protein